MVPPGDADRPIGNTGDRFSEDMGLSQRRSRTDSTDNLCCLHGAAKGAAVDDLKRDAFHSPRGETGLLRSERCQAPHGVGAGGVLGEMLSMPYQVQVSLPHSSRFLSRSGAARPRRQLQPRGANVQRPPNGSHLFALSPQALQREFRGGLAGIFQMHAVHSQVAATTSQPRRDTDHSRRDQRRMPNGSLLRRPFGRDLETSRLWPSGRPPLRRSGASR